MNYIRINKFSKIPLYLQIKDSIKEAILSGQIKNHDRLPTEESICRFYHISRPVVRQAYQELIDEGLVIRHQGQGTFVSRNIIFSNIFFKPNFKEELLNRGILPESKILSCDRVDIRDIPGIGSLPEEYQDFYLVIRLRKGNGIPLFLEYFYFPQHLFPDFQDRLQDDSSISELVTRDYGYSDIGNQVQMNAVVVEEPIATLLEVKPGTAALKFIMYNRLEDGRLAFYKNAYFPGERHRIDIEATEE